MIKYLLIIISLSAYSADLGGLKPLWQYEMYIDGELACEYKPSNSEGMVFNVPMVSGQHTIELKEVMQLEQPDPIPPPILMLQTTLPEKIDYPAQTPYLTVPLDIVQPSNNTKMDIYIDDYDKCFLAVKANKRYSSNDYKQWVLLLVPYSSKHGTCRLIARFLYNGFDDRRLIYIENL